MAKFYKKKGNLNWKERKIIAEIEETIALNPDKKSLLYDVTDFKQLEKLRLEIVSEDTGVLDSSESNPTVSKEEVKDVKEPIKEESMSQDNQRPTKKFDPFNREEPIVRDYVMENQFEEEPIPKRSNSQPFSEPQNFAEAFEIPTAESEEEEHYVGTASDSGKRGGGGSSGSGGGNSTGSSYSASDDSGDSAKARKRSKRFAKSVVNMVCTLAELGFIWWTSKEINESKLAEYELSGEYDLSQILEMEDQQQVTVKQFFLMQLGTIQEAAKIDDAERAELTDALTEVFIEENIQPSPKYDLVLTALTVFGKKGLVAYSIQQQQKAVLEQLRIKKETGRVPTPPPAPTQTPPPSQQATPRQPVSTPATPIHDALSKELEYDSALINSLNNPQETLE